MNRRVVIWAVILAAVAGITQCTRQLLRALENIEKSVKKRQEDAEK